MNTSSRFFLPAGLSSPALAVPVASPDLDRGLYLALLESKLKALVEGDEEAARAAMEMSQESAPELWAIAEQYPLPQWASAIAQTDGMVRLLAPVEWTEPAQEVPEQDAQEVSLAEILELLP